MGRLGAASTDSDVEYTEAQKLRKWFFGVPWSMLTLFQSVTDGLSWGEVCDALFIVDPPAGCLFVFYIAFTFFCVVNIVTSIFVESAMQVNSRHRELLVNERSRVRTIYAKHVQEIFESID